MVNYNKEGPSDKKQSHFSLVLATQLAAEQKHQRAGPDDSMAKLQCSIALKLMKQSYMAPSVCRVWIKVTIAYSPQLT
jgi:hypothetical protein